MARTEQTVDELINEIERGVVRLPEIQRRYIWKSTQVRDLFDSLYRRYPSGTILLWETDDKEQPLQNMAIEQQDNPYSNTRLLLDGQQRLTSLATVIRGKPVTVGGREKNIELLFNLEHPGDSDIDTEAHEEGPESKNGEERIEDETEEDRITRLLDDWWADELGFNRMTFVVATKILERLPQWVKVSEVFKNDDNTIFLRQAGVKNFDDPKCRRYTDRLNKLREIRKYTYRIDVLDRSLPYNEVTEIFVRVNSLGAKLRSADLALAQITAKWRNSLKEFEKFQEECKKSGFNLDLGSVHLRNMVVFATAQSGETAQSGFSSVKNLSKEILQKSWRESCQGMEFALNFMCANAGLESPALLASPFVLIAIAYFGKKRNYSLSPEEEKELRYWVLLANAKGRYSRGSSETILNQDLAVLHRDEGVSELLEQLKRQVGNLEIKPEELAGRNQNSALFKTMFLAFRAADAKDWHSNIAIAINHRGSSHKLQFHHIFPQARLKGAYTPREVNDIANLCFIAGKTNRQIRDKEPKDYFPEIIDKNGLTPFEAQCIPTEERLLNRENYKEFLLERRKRIATRLNEFLKEK